MEPSSFLYYTSNKGFHFQGKIIYFYVGSRHRLALLDEKYKYNLKNRNIYRNMDSHKQLKLSRFPQRTCKLMRLKVVI